MLLFSPETYGKNNFNGLKLRLPKNQLMMQAKIYTAYKVNKRDVLILISGFKHVCFKSTIR